MELASSWYIAYTGIMLLAPTILQALGLSLGVPLLRNLLGYYASEESSNALKTKSQKKAVKAAADPHAPAYQLYQLPLSREYILVAPYYERLESCILALITFVLVTVLQFGLLSMDTSVGGGLGFAAVMLLGVTSFSLFQMDMWSNDQPRVEKQIFAGIGAATSVLCWLALTFAPPSVLNLDFQAVAEDMGAIINAPIMAKMQELGSGQNKYRPILISSFFIPVLLSLLAGLQVMLLLNPAVRYGRALYLIMAPPRWAKQLVKYNSFQVAAAKISFVLPLLCLVLWAKPLTDSVLLSPATLEWLQPCSLLVTALMQFIILRPFIQAHLYKGFLDWYVLTHDGKNTRHKPLLIKAKLDIVWDDRAKVTIQMMSLSLFLLPIATLLLLDSPLADHFGVSSQQRLTMLFFCKFFGVWTCLVWWVFSCVTMTIYRMGFTSN